MVEVRDREEQAHSNPWPCFAGRPAERRQRKGEGLPLSGGRRRSAQGSPLLTTPPPDHHHQNENELAASSRAVMKKTLHRSPTRPPLCSLTLRITLDRIARGFAAPNAKRTLSQNGYGHRQTDRQTDRQAGRQAGRQADRGDGRTEGGRKHQFGTTRLGLPKQVGKKDCTRLHSSSHSRSCYPH